MYVIVVYDVGEKRVGKMLKLCRQYLCWIQNSVFEGALSEAKLRELKLKIKGIIDPSEDSIIIFTNKIGFIIRTTKTKNDEYILHIKFVKIEKNIVNRINALACGYETF